MAYSFKRNAIAITIFALLMIQIVCFIKNIMHIRTGDQLNPDQTAYLKYLYTSQIYFEEMKDQLEVIQYINDTIYENILQVAIKQNTKEVLLLLSNDVNRLDKMSDSDQQYIANIIKTRLNRNFLKHKEMKKENNPRQQFTIKAKPIAAKAATKNPAHSGTAKPAKAIPSKLEEQPENVKRMKWGKPQIREGGGSYSPKCVVKQSELYGREKIDVVEYGMDKLEQKFIYTLEGGRWYPRNCKPTLRIAIIIPYRDRDRNLKLLLQTLIPKLRRQKVDYTFYVVEQASGSKFNRGMMRNIGFIEARKFAKYDCYIFNDVDTFIEDDRNLYTCLPGTAYHIAVRISRYKYRLPYEQLIGGILSFKQDLFLQSNGYPNFFFIWGGEDDAMYHRIRKVGGKIMRPNYNVSYTTTMQHDRDPKLGERHSLVKRDSFFWKKDGLNTLDYEILVTEKRKLYTWIYVRVDELKYIQMLRNYKEEWDRLHPQTAALPSPQPRLKQFKQFASKRIGN